MPVDLNRLKEIAPDVAADIESHEDWDSLDKMDVRFAFTLWFQVGERDGEVYPSDIIRALDAIRAAEVPEDPRVPSTEPSEWWCPNCRRVVDWQNVTFEERHESCGCAVEIAPKGEPSLEELLEKLPGGCRITKYISAAPTGVTWKGWEVHTWRGNLLAQGDTAREALLAALKEVEK